MLKTFPSPLGVSYSQIGKFDIIGIYPVGFRPLSGYLISKFKVRVYKLRGLNKFPSPLGVSYFQMSAFLVLNLFLVKVSVPSRGILFPNRVKQRIKAMNPSFRPLSGYLISKYSNSSMVLNIISPGFRPPVSYTHLTLPTTERV